MDPKELQEYKQKLTGLSVKDLTDILSHINKEKVPEKFGAVEEEIAARGGAPRPAAEIPKTAPKAVPKPAPKPKAPPEPEPVKAAPPVKEAKPAAAAQPKAPGNKEPANMLLSVVSAVFFLAGIYFLLIPFLNVPGAMALRAIFAKLPPHF